MAALQTRLAECHLEMHPTKTKIVYCKALEDVADEINPVLRGWIEYYGRYYLREAGGEIPPAYSPQSALGDGYDIPRR
jgi:Group II intron, maturase-specific domain